MSKMAADVLWKPYQNAGGVIVGKLSRDEMTERVEKISQGMGSDKEVNVWIEEIAESVPNRQVIETIMAGNGVSAAEIVDRLYKADVICL